MLEQPTNRNVFGKIFNCDVNDETKDLCRVVALPI